MEQLNQRIRVRFHLKALSLEETKEYIQHRLKIAGREKGELFPAATIPMIHRYTGGIPRLINTLCDTTLIMAFVEEQKTITAELIEEAIEELQWVPYRERLAKKTTSISAAMRYSAQQIPRLILEKKGDKIQEYTLNQEYTTLGRYTGNEVVLEDRSVSGHHAKIITIEGRSFLKDLNSTNGTYVNSERIKRCVLKNGDVISLARGRLEYLEETITSATTGNPHGMNLLNNTLQV
jgi:Cdc6-like AAA superfamily ATPase